MTRGQEDIQKPVRAVCAQIRSLLARVYTEKVARPLCTRRVSQDPMGTFPCRLVQQCRVVRSTRPPPDAPLSRSPLRVLTDTQHRFYSFLHFHSLKKEKRKNQAVVRLFQIVHKIVLQSNWRKLECFEVLFIFVGM